FPTFGCGQSVPQRMRSGAASISWRAKGTASVNGGPIDDTRSAPQIFTQNLSCFIHSSSSLNGGWSRPSAALTRPMWSIPIGAVAARVHDDCALDPQGLMELL